MSFRYFGIFSPFKVWTNLNPIHPRMPCASIWLKLAEWFWRIGLFISVFSLYHYIIIYLEEGVDLHSIKLESLPPMVDCWNWLSGKVFKSSMYFRYVVIISPWKREWPLNKPELPPSKYLCTKLGWNWSSGSGKEDFLNFRYFVIISPWK